jgi:hypothetical protein
MAPLHGMHPKWEIRSRIGCMNSLFPTRCIFDHVAASPFRVAPEAAENLVSNIARRNITLAYVENPAVLAEYSPSQAIVTVGGGYLDALWAAAHLYLVAIRAYQEAQKDGKSMFGLAEDSRVAAAYLLYLDRMKLVAQGVSQEWPKDSPKPTRYPFKHTDGYATNELFLVAIGWVIHHEIAHAMLDHEEGSIDSVREEKQADREATRWVCTQPADDDELFKRAIGISTAILFLIALDLHLSRRTLTTHPPSWERLLDALDIACLADDHRVYAFTFVMLDIHLAAHGITGNNDRSGTFRDMCVGACMLLRASTL